MNENLDTPDKPRSPKDWLSLVWDLIWDWKRIGGHLKIELRHAKSFPLLLACCLLLVAFFYNKGCKLETERSSLVNTNSFLIGQLSVVSNDLVKTRADIDRQKTEHITKLTELKADNAEEIRRKDIEALRLQNERDNALHRAAVVEAMPGNLYNIYTNIAANAPTNLGQFNLVLSDITNALSAIAQEPSFNLFINGKSTPSESIVSLGQSRTLTIVIEESHKVSADNLQLDFWLPRDLDPTNCIAEGWTLSPNKPFLHQSGLLHEMEGNIWTWKANQLATGGGLYAVNRFEFKKEAALSNFLARFDIAASRAKSQKIFVQFLVNE